VTDETAAQARTEEQLPHAKLKARSRISWLWLLPVAAAGLLIYLGYQTLVKRGPTISISFETGDGLAAHQTQVKYKSVVLGTVQEVRLSADMSHVTARVRMNQAAERFLTDHARFWVVRPRFDGVSSQALTSGLQTLVSGSYIAIDPGAPGGTSARSFKGLEEPPGVRSGEPGRELTLGAATLGSVGVGTPVFYRDVSVGEVLGYSLRGGERPFELRVFIHAPYDALIGARSQFWTVSGIRLTNDAQGFRIEMQSIRAALTGGIAFENPTDANLGWRQPSAQDASLPAEFALYDSRAEAEMEMHATVASCAAYFETPLNGLKRGSDVTLLGQVVGAVTELRLVRNPNHPRRGYSVRVSFVLQPQRAPGTVAEREITAENVPALISKGLRAIIESKSFITGEKGLALRFVPARAGPVIRESDEWVLPSEVRSLEDLQSQATEFANKLNRIPLDRIGDDLSRTLRHVNETVSAPELQRSVKSIDAALFDFRNLMHQARTDLAPVLQRLPQIAHQLQAASERVNSVLGSGGYGSNSDFQRSATRLLEQLSEAARSIRVLAETLERYPESILVGKPPPGEQ